MAAQKARPIAATHDEPRSLHRRLDQTTWQEIAAKYEAGATTPALCAEYNVSKGGLLGILREQGVTLRRQPLTSDQVEETARLYGYGFSIAAIADYLDTSYNNVRQNLERLGIERRPRGGSRTKATPRMESLSHEQRMRAVLLYTAGGALEAVAQAIGASTEKTRAALLSQGVPIRAKGRPSRSVSRTKEITIDECAVQDRVHLRAAL